MSAPQPNRAVLAAFADLFSYPRGDLAGAARRCLDLLEPGHPAAPFLRKFASWAGRAREGEIEELYTSTFDLAPACAPYVGFQISPDAGRRNLFLSSLASVYEREGFRPREELGDHLSEVLRFLAAARDPEARQTLIREGLVPAVEKMACSFQGKSNPWRSLLDALLACLAPAGRRHPPPPEIRP
ncbi:MAG TPA: molecular chaperone TorD family protein [Myxococcales bacterium]|nr:molecular chaperone TorD family protein [Myxococcales bacterium]